MRPAAPRDRPPKRRSPRLVNAGGVRRASRLAGIVTLAVRREDRRLRERKRAMLDALAADLGSAHPDFAQVRAMAERLA